MINIVELENRYKGIQYSVYHTGKGVYLINSDEPISLNRCNGYVLNELGLVEEYKFVDNEQSSYWARDKAGEMKVSDAEYLEQFRKGNHVWCDSLHIVDNPAKTIYTYRAKPEDYYPHTWYPDRKIIEFECIRIAPMWMYGKRYEVFTDSDGSELIEGDDNETRLWIDEVLNYPEFFKPIYEENNSNT